MPALNATMPAWQTYVEGLGKPMNDIWVSAHPNGADVLEGVNVGGTQAAADAIAAGSTRATADSLAAAGHSDRGWGEASVHSALALVLHAASLL